MAKEKMETVNTNNSLNICCKDTRWQLVGVSRVKELV